MKVIKRYELRLFNEVTEIHKDAELLSAAYLNSNIYIWALVDPSCPLVSKRFRIVGAGQDFTNLPDDSHFLDTIINGINVWHVFDCGEVEFE